MHEITAIFKRIKSLFKTNYDCILFSFLTVGHSKNSQINFKKPKKRSSQQPTFSWRPLHLINLTFAAQWSTQAKISRRSNKLDVNATIVINEDAKWNNHNKTGTNSQHASSKLKQNCAFHLPDLCSIWNQMPGRECASELIQLRRAVNITQLRLFEESLTRTSICDRDALRAPPDLRGNRPHLRASLLCLNAAA